jgi:hypothetical protein
MTLCTKMGLIYLVHVTQFSVPTDSAKHNVSRGTPWTLHRCPQADDNVFVPYCPEIDASITVVIRST